MLRFQKRNDETGVLVEFYGIGRVGHEDNAELYRLELNDVGRGTLWISHPVTANALIFTALTILEALNAMPKPPEVNVRVVLENHLPQQTEKGDES